MPRTQPHPGTHGFNRCAELPDPTLLTCRAIVLTLSADFVIGTEHDMPSPSPSPPKDPPKNANQCWLLQGGSLPAWRSVISKARRGIINEKKKFFFDL